LTPVARRATLAAIATNCVRLEVSMPSYKCPKCGNQVVLIPVYHTAPEKVTCGVCKHTFNPQEDDRR
jgi:ribosomal protein S27AE